MYDKIKSQRKVDTQSKTSSHSQRRVDSKASDIVTMFLQHNFFQRVFDKSVVNVDKQSQLIGVDVYAEKWHNLEKLKQVTNDEYLLEEQRVKQVYLIDCKAQLNYINKPTNTFAIEVEFKARNGKLMQGWGMMPITSDAFYLFTWLPECYDSGRGKAGVKRHTSVFYQAIYYLNNIVMNLTK